MGETTKGVLIKESVDVTTDEWTDLPVALDGTHFAPFHPWCWEMFFKELQTMDFGAAFMMFVGNVVDLTEVVLVPDG